MYNDYSSCVYPSYLHVVLPALKFFKCKSKLSFQSGDESEPEIDEEEIEELLLDAQQILDEVGAGAKEVGEKGYNLRPLREKNPEI